MPNTVIETIDLQRIFQSGPETVRAVDGISLKITEGEFTSIVGPSGSGKTTMLNLLGGLDAPTQGKVIIGGTDIYALKESDRIEFRLRNIGFVFQAYNLIPVLTALENVEFIMMLQNKDKEERRERATSLLKSVGLQNEMDRRPGKLSGGQQQRVAVARALATRPRFVLADEPTANLDSKSAEQLLDIMVQLNEEEQITFVFSTHDERVIRRAKRVITLVDGKMNSDKVTEKAL
jgi:putative ABC transport system ATP-binding protein